MEPERGPAGDPVPVRAGHAHGPEQPVIQQVRQALTGDQLHHPGQHEGRRVVVRVPAPDRVRGRHPQEALDQIGRFQLPRFRQRVGPVPGRHRQQMPDAELPRPRCQLSRDVEHVGNSIIQSKQAVSHREPDRNRSEGLGQRVKKMRPVSRVRRPPALRDHPAMPHHHDRMALHRPLRQPVKQTQHPPGIHPLTRRHRSRQQPPLTHQSSATPPAFEAPTTPNSSRMRPSSRRDNATPSNRPTMGLQYRVGRKSVLPMPQPLGAIG